MVREEGMKRVLGDNTLLVHNFRVSRNVKKMPFLKEILHGYSE
jgi:hypothetical protein